MFSCISVNAELKVHQPWKLEPRPYIADVTGATAGGHVFTATVSGGSALIFINFIFPRLLKNCSKSPDLFDTTSPLVWVPRMRDCVEWRTINKKSMIFAYPMPHAVPILRELDGMFLYIFDLGSGFHQMNMDRNNSKGTAVVFILWGGITSCHWSIFQIGLKLFFASVIRIFLFTQRACVSIFFSL